MSSELSPDTESFIASEVAVGAYRSREAALEAGVALLRRRKELLDKLDEGQRALDAGQYVSMSEAELRAFFDGMKQRVRDRIRTSSN